MDVEIKMTAWTSTFKELFSLALPLIFSNIVSSAAGIISMFFIAQISANALAAGAVISSTYGLCIMMSVSILYSISISIGHSYSGKNDLKINDIIASGMGLALIISIPVLLLFLNIGPILKWMRQPIEICQMAGDYFRGLSFGLLPSLLVAVFSQFFMGIKKARLILFFTLFALLLNASLSYLLIFGLGSIKPLALYGAGLAASIAAISQLILILAYLLLHPTFKSYHIFANKIISFAHSRMLLNIGLPIAIQYSTELLAFSTITYFMGMLGRDALAAQQISLQLSLLLIMIGMGMSQAGAILISHQMNHDAHANRLLISKLTLITGMGIILLLGLGYILFSERLIALYLEIHNQSLQPIVNIAKNLILIAVITQFFDAGRNISTGLLRGYGDSKTAMWTSLIACWLIGIPLAFILGFKLHSGAIGLRVGMMTGIFFGCFLLFHKLLKQLKSKKAVAPHEIPGVERELPAVAHKK